MSHPSSAGSGQIRARHFAGLFLLSLATLLLELALTRVLSVSLWYHFGFLVISTALLGFGASGVTLALWTRLRERTDLDLGLGTCGLVFAVGVVFSFWLMQRIPFDPFSVAVDHRQFLFMPIYFLLVALPFFCSGLAISLLLTRGSRAINLLYGYDLLGAGAGCALVRFANSKIWRIGNRTVGRVRWSFVSGVLCVELPACSCHVRHNRFSGAASGKSLGRKGRPNPREREQEPTKHQLHLFRVEHIVVRTGCGISSSR